MNLGFCFHAMAPSNRFDWYPVIVSCVSWWFSFFFFFNFWIKPFLFSLFHFVFCSFISFFLFCLFCFGANPSINLSAVISNQSRSIFSLHADSLIGRWPWWKWLVVAERQPRKTRSAVIFLFSHFWILQLCVIIIFWHSMHDFLISFKKLVTRQIFCARILK